MFGELLAQLHVHLVGVAPCEEADGFLARDLFIGIDHLAQRELWLRQLRLTAAPSIEIELSCLLACRCQYNESSAELQCVKRFNRDFGRREPNSASGNPGNQCR
jgi:hypothetical protein